jgi:hypothetical protein
MSHRTDVQTTLTRIDQAQEQLRRLFAPIDRARLAERPPSGEWSPLEHVRHLVFAEQHHFGPYLEKGFRWSSIGVLPPNRTGERRLNSVGSDPSTPVAEVFDAWAKIHALVRERALEAPEQYARTLEGNLGHVNLHARVIRDLLGG